MNSMDKIKEELEKVMSEKFEKEFRDTWGIIARAYGVGIDEGQAKARTEIINLIQGENK